MAKPIYSNKASLTMRYNMFMAARQVFRLRRSDHIISTAGCECLKGLFSRSPCRLIGLSMAMPRSTAVHTDRRHSVSTKTAVFFIRRSTRSCGQTAYYWTSCLPCRRCSHMERPTGWRYLSTIFAHLQKTTKL